MLNLCKGIMFLFICMCEYYIYIEWLYWYNIFSMMFFLFVFIENLWVFFFIKYNILLYLEIIVRCYVLNFLV